MTRRLACIITAALLGSCGSHPTRDGEPYTATGRHATPLPLESEAREPDRNPDLSNGLPSPLPPELNTARSAAMAVAHLPPVADARTRREIRLHAALYRAAYDLSLKFDGDRGAHPVLLESASKAGQGDLPISGREFHLRVLALLAEVGVPIGWAHSGPSSEAIGHDSPRGRESATRLAIRILQRREEQAAVSAEVSHHTPGAGSARYRMVATWDGQAWTIQPGRIRVQW